MGAFNIIDTLIQLPKHQQVSTSELQNIARAARGQIFVMANQDDIEVKRLEKWNYGELFDSKFDEEISELAEAEKIIEKQEK